MRAPLQHRQVLRFVHLLVLITSGAALVLLGLAYGNYTREVRDRQHLAEDHVRMLMLSRVAAEHVGRLTLAHRAPRDEARDRAPAADGSAGSMARASAADLFSIQQALDSIAAMHALGEAPQPRVVERARQRLLRVRAALEATSEEPARLDVELASLGLAVHQLDRLQAIAAREELVRMSRQSGQRIRTLALLSALLLVATTWGVFRVTKLVRERLQRLHEAEEALRHSERQLLQAQKMEALGTLVGGVAHDFNNLLTAILGNAELMLAGATLGGRQRDHVEEIRKAGHRAAGLTRQLLAFSRHELIESTVVDLSALLHETRPLLRRVLREDLALEVEVDADCRVLADEVQLQQVVINLVVNARDAMADGGRVVVSLTRVALDGQQARRLSLPSAGAWVRLRVDDTGPGVEPELRERVFEPFFTTKERGKGTGLGLSTVHGIVRRCGGCVQIDERPGGGARFDVLLPACARQERAPAAEPAGAPGGGGETVLVVEDEAPLRELLGTCLREAGYRVLEADDGPTALQVCRESRAEVDLILTDVILPGLPGPRLVEQALELCPRARVVFVSGYSSGELLERVRASSHAFVAKPFDMRDLLAVIRRELDAGARRRRPPERVA